jgi:pyrimidine-nucleoside phosphorylase
MDQPLGFAVGNMLEVKEAIHTLRGKGPHDLMEICLALGSQMLVLGGKAEQPEEAREILEEVLLSGKALAKLREFVQAQGGDPSPVDDLSLFPEAPLTMEVPSPAKGWVSSIKADTIGRAALALGAGREKKDSPIDLKVGIVLQRKVGVSVQKGDSLATIYASDKKKAEEAMKMVLSAFSVVPEKVDPHVLIKGIVEKEGVERPWK